MSDPNLYGNSSRLDQLADADKPREKLLRYGASTLTDSELLAILIVSGVKGNNVLQVSKTVLSAAGNDLDRLGRFTVEEFQKTVKGIGQVKAIMLVAALELGRRRRAKVAQTQLIQIKHSQYIFDYVEDLFEDLDVEIFVVLMLNRMNKVLAHSIVSRGGVSGTVVDVKTVFRSVFTTPGTGSTSSIILSHNHPSGNLNPSLADIALTKQIVSAGALLDISVLDHVIVGKGEYYSFVDDGKMPTP